MRFGKSRSQREGRRTRLGIGGFAVSAVIVASVAGFTIAADQEISLWPTETGQKEGTASATETPDAVVVDQFTPSADADAATDLTPSRTLNLDIGRLDRSSDQKTPLPPVEGLSVNPLQRQRVQIEIRPNPNAKRSTEFTMLPLPDGVTLGENDIQAKTAITEIPKGEGYEASVGANTQGKLILLGRQKMNDDGTPQLDKDGNPVMTPMFRGMPVKEGEILGVQFNQACHARRVAAERELVVAEKEAAKQLEIEVAKASWAVAEMEYKRAISANEKMPKSVSEEEIWQKKFEAIRGKKSAEKAEYDLTIAAEQVKVKEAAVLIADADLEERLIRSPITGQVDEIFKNKGEWLREGDPVLHVLRLDKVNISAKFDGASVTPAMIEGKVVTVYASKAGQETQKLEGVITYARPVLEVGMFTAYAEVKNMQIDGNWFLMPGMRVNLIVHKDQTAERTVDETPETPATSAAE